MKIFQALKEYERQRKDKAATLEKNLCDLQAAYALGMVHFEYKRSKKARESFERALKLNLDFAPARDKLAESDKLKPAAAAAPN